MGKCQLFSYRLSTYKKKFYICIFKYGGNRTSIFFRASYGLPPANKEDSQTDSHVLDYMPDIFQAFTPEYLLIKRISNLEILNKMLNNKYKYLIKNQNYTKL